jgi:hypothetical protein
MIERIGRPAPVASRQLHALVVPTRKRVYEVEGGWRRVGEVEDVMTKTEKGVDVEEARGDNPWILTGTHSLSHPMHCGDFRGSPRWRTGRELLGRGPSSRPVSSIAPGSSKYHVLCGAPE